MQSQFILNTHTKTHALQPNMSFSHLLLSLTFLCPLFATAHLCSPEFSTEVKNRFISMPNCRKKTLDAEFGWNFDNKSRQLDLAFGARLDHSESGWLAWGLNPHEPHMVETRALIGIKNPNGSLEQHMYTITEATRRGCQLLPAKDIGLNVSYFKFVYLEKTQYYAIFATILLPLEFNSSRTNVVWQIGDAVEGSEPKMHHKSLKNLNSAEVLDLVSGRILSFAAHKRRHLIIAHGILNIVGWGTLLPIGVMVARYFKTHPKQWIVPIGWFNFHVGCQSAGYIIGSTGWALGIWLGKTSKYYSFHTHQILGIIIFTFTTIQMLALRLRPKSDDEYRTYWNMYHHFLGYSLLALISVNIFVGINILRPDHIWEWAYLGVLGALGLVAFVFEAISWIKFLMDRSYIVDI